MNKGLIICGEKVFVHAKALVCFLFIHFEGEIF
jgi:hypothetical protein